MTTNTQPDPSTVARSVLARLEAAWNNADGPGFGAVYTPEASYVTVRGEHLTGAAVIGQGHAQIFTSIYAGSTNSMDLVRAETAGNAVLAVAVNTLSCPTGPLAGVHRAMSTSLITPAVNGSWHIVATQNTLVA